MFFPLIYASLYMENITEVESILQVATQTTYEMSDNFSLQNDK